MLVVIFIFTLSACNSKDTSPNIDTSPPTQSEEIIKPENYSTVLLIRINPHFKLYLDENNNVLALEPINEDAKSFSDSIDFENKSIETVIGNIVEQANEKGFIKENAIIDFEIAEKQEKISNNDILTNAISAAQSKAKELNIEIKTQIKENIEENSSETENTETSKPTISKTTHTHSYSNANCITPQKCSCGQTKGSALGHKWQVATCKAPKTCSVCKATEGNVAEHKYDKFVCTLCGFKDEEGIATATNPRLSFKPKTYTTKYSDDYLTEIGLFVSTITFGETMGWSGDMYWSTEYINSPHFPKDEYKDIMSQEYIVYNSNKYYLFTGSGDSCVDWSYELTDKYIIVFDKGQQILKFTLNLDGTLYVVDSKETSGHLKILVGTTLI